MFPDIGVATYLKRTWSDAAFRVASLNDRRPVAGDEDLVIVAAADPQGAADCVKLAELVPPATPLVLFNARLVSGALAAQGAALRCDQALCTSAVEASRARRGAAAACGDRHSACGLAVLERPGRVCAGDVGIGLNVRRMRKQFLGQFVTTYSIRPIDDIGTIFRRWPAQWRVFVQDETKPGRYKLIAERSERPAGVYALGLTPQVGCMTGQHGDVCAPPRQAQHGRGDPSTAAPSTARTALERSGRNVAERLQESFKHPRKVQSACAFERARSHAYMHKTQQQVELGSVRDSELRVQETRWTAS